MDGFASPRCSGADGQNTQTTGHGKHQNESPTINDRTIADGSRDKRASITVTPLSCDPARKGGPNVQQLVCHYIDFENKEVSDHADMSSRHFYPTTPLPELIAGLEIECQWAMGVSGEVHLQDLLAHVVVVQLAVAQGHVHVEGQVLTVLDKDLLVDICGFLVCEHCGRLCSGNHL